jgi:hypothetical protein
LLFSVFCLFPSALLLYQNVRGEPEEEKGEKREDRGEGGEER